MQFFFIPYWTLSYTTENQEKIYFHMNICFFEEKLLISDLAYL